MRPPLILHINYVEQGQSLGEAFKKAEQWGYQGIEIRRRRVKLSETDEEYLDQIAQAHSETTLPHVIFGSPGANLMAEDERTRRLEIESLNYFYTQASQRLNLTIGNTDAGLLKNTDTSIPYVDYEKHGSFVATDSQWERAVSGLREIGEHMKTLGVRLALETHMVYLHDLPQVTLDLVEKVGHESIGVNLDYGNAVYFKDRLPLEDLLPRLNPHLHYVHLKNSVHGQAFRQPTALAEGEINHRQYLSLLQKMDYTGPICLEAPRSGDREWYARQDIAYVNQLLDDLNWN